MNEQEFLLKAKKMVVDYTNKHLDKADGASISVDDVFNVWHAKVLQNSKGLFSTTLLDGMYYEITYNGDKDVFYLDAYKKFENVEIKND